MTRNTEPSHIARILLPQPMNIPPRNPAPFGLEPSVQYPIAPTIGPWYGNVSPSVDAMNGDPSGSQPYGGSAGMPAFSGNHPPLPPIPNLTNAAYPVSPTMAASNVEYEIPNLTNAAYPVTPTMSAAQGSAAPPIPLPRPRPDAMAQAPAFLPQSYPAATSFNGQYGPQWTDQQWQNYWDRAQGQY